MYYKTSPEGHPDVLDDQDTANAGCVECFGDQSDYGGEPWRVQQPNGNNHYYIAIPLIWDFKTNDWKEVPASMKWNRETKAWE